MKRCPECKRDYFDDSLLFCLDDGTALLEGPSSGDHQTAVLPSELETRHIATSTGQSTAAPMSSAEYIVTNLGRHKLAAGIVIVLLVAVLGGVGYLIYQNLSRSSANTRGIRLEKVTTEGKTFSVGISPDGKYAVYNVDEGTAESLWTRQIATSSPVQVIPPAEGVIYSSIRFTPDGNFVTFGKRDANSAFWTVYQMPVLGGTQKKIATDVDGGITYSPDGKMITFLRGHFPEMGESSVMIANADGTNERVLATRRRPETFPWWPVGTVAWSPDGRKIACAIGGAATGSGPMYLAEVNVEDGSVKQLTSDGLYEITQIAWLPDGSGLLVIAAQRATDFHTQQVYLVSYPDGDIRRITADFNNYVGMSLTADGKTLAAVQSSRVSNLWVAPNADAAQARQVKSGGTNQEGTDGLGVAPDGRIAFYSKASGEDDIWIVNADGSGVKQLTSDAGTNYDLEVTPDGRHILFTSERAGQPNIWRMDLDGGNPKQLTLGKSEYGVAVTPDSKWAFYDSVGTGGPTVWKIPIDGGAAVKFIELFGEDAEVSPDGKLVACQYRESVAGDWKLGIFSINGGAPVQTLGRLGERTRFAPDSSSLTYVRTINGVSNIWSQPLTGGAPKQMTNFTNDRIFNYKWSPDGKTLVMARGTRMSDIVLIHDFR